MQDIAKGIAAPETDAIRAIAAAEAAAKDALIAKLKALLAEARQPWQWLIG